MRLCLVLALIAALPGQVRAGAELVGSYVWRMDSPLFGGLSSLETDGDRFWTTSDKGAIASGVFERLEGRIVGVTAAKIAPLLTPKGDPVRRYAIDAEGIARGPDGTTYVSFEAEHRVWAYPDPFGPARPLPIPGEFRALQNNSSLEALAVDAAGTLYTMPERSGEIDRPFPVWRYRNGIWDQPFALRRDGDFLAVGADFGPDGKLYLLERRNVLITFATRVRRFTLDGDKVTGEETLLETDLGVHGDLEGIDVTEVDGKIRLTMIADDNFQPFMRTEIVEYLITE